MTYRIGQGFDVHALEADIPLKIGGVEVPSAKGSLGHSDGDVLYHAIVDALLGALSLGDIGTYFPSTEERWRGASSKIFLKHASQLISDRSFIIENVDATVILQEPKIAPFIDTMRRNIARLLKVSNEQISVKATTTDRLGFTGEGRGLAAFAVVLITKKSTP